MGRCHLTVCWYLSCTGIAGPRTSHEKRRLASSPSSLHSAKQAVREFFAMFSRIFRGFRGFFEVFGLARTCSDPFGSIRMCSNAFGCVPMRSDTFGKFRICFAKSAQKTRFLQFWQGFGWARGKRTSKSASASNFAQDTSILRSVRPKIVMDCPIRWNKRQM